MLSVMAIASAYLMSLIPVYLGKVLDGFAIESNEIVQFIIIFTTVFLLAELLNIFRRVSIDCVSAQLEEDLRNNSINKLLHLPLKYIETNGVSGELTSKINQVVGGTTQLMKLLTNDLLPAVCVGFFVIVQCSRQAPLIIALILIGYMITTLSASLLQIKSQRGVREEIIRKKTKLDGDICQSINGIEQIRVLSAEESESVRLAPQTKGIRQTECLHHTKMGVYDAFKHFLKTAFFIFILFAGVYLTKRGDMSGGNVLAVVLLFQQLLKPLDEFYRFLDEISACSIKVSILNDILNQPSDTVFHIPEASISFDKNDIEINEYEVFSPDSKKLLSKSSNVSFKAGHSTALVARTGGGKSSLLKGLMRLYPLKGSAVLFGVKLSIIPQKLLTKIVHYIPQSPYFFSGSIKENLLYGLEGVPSDDVLNEILKKVCLFDELFVNRRNVLEIQIQENGKNMSGGQLKRLAFARALLRNPMIYFLDETTANIDENTVSLILGNFEKHVKEIGAGIVYVTHEQRVIERCYSKVELPALAIQAT
jgi:ABC-type multidrug transport system fused ATPase/permease subunit